MRALKTKSRHLSRQVRRRFCWRLLWAIAFLLHVPITFKAFATLLDSDSGGTAWSSIFLLSLTNAFFVLEIAFACSIRVLSDRRSMLVFMLAIAFLHAGVIERSAPDAVRDWSLGVGGLPLAFGAVVTVLLITGVLKGLIVAACLQEDQPAVIVVQFT